MNKYILILLLIAGSCFAQQNKILYTNDGKALIKDSLDLLRTASDLKYQTKIFLNVKDFGAKGDGVTDDTQAIQDALDYAYNDGNYRSVKMVIPSGEYKITRTLTYQGVPSNGIIFQGEQGDARGITGARFEWQGKPKGTMLYFTGVNGSQINDIGIVAGTHDTTAIGSLETAIWIDATNSDPVWTSVNISTFVLSSNIITVTTDAAHNLLKNRPVRITGVTGYNGLYLVDSVVNSTSFRISYYGDNYSTTGGTAIRVRTGGSSGVRMNHINIEGVNGYDCAGIRFANGLNAGTEQVSEVYMDHILIGGTDSYLGSGIKTEQTGNTTDFWFRSGSIWYFHIAVNTNSNGIVGLSDMSFSLCDTLIKTRTQNLMLSNCRAEGDMVILVGSTGANAGSVTIQNCQFNISSADTNDIIANYTGTLSLYGNQFYNTRTAYTQPKFIVGDILTNAGAGMGGFISIGNFYQNAVDYPAVYYSTNADSGYLAFDGSYFKGTGRNVISMGDYGGTYGNIIPLNHYLPAHTVSSTDSIIAQSGFIRMSENDIFAWRNHANTDNVSISKDTTDKIIIGNLNGVEVKNIDITNLPTDTTGLVSGKLYNDIRTGSVQATVPRNLILNGDFDEWTTYGTYEYPTHWTEFDTTSTMIVAEQSPTGRLHITANGTGAGQIYSHVNRDSGVTYGYSFQVYEIVDTFLLYPAGQGKLITETGVYSGEFTATDNLNIFSIVARASGYVQEITLDNIRIWEVGGAVDPPAYDVPVILDSLGRRVLPDTASVTDGYVPKRIGNDIVWSPDISTSGSGLFNPDGVTIDTTVGGLARVLPAKVTEWDSVRNKQNADADLTDLSDGELTASKVGGVKDADYGDITVSSGVWSVEDNSHSHTMANIADLTDSLAAKMNRAEMTSYSKTTHTHIEFSDTVRVAGWGIGMGNTEIDTITTGSFGGIKMPNDYTITEIAAYTNSGTVTFNIEERGETTPNSSGTDVMGSNLTADTDQQESTSFTNAIILKNNWLVLTIASISGEPTVFNITIRGIKTD